MRKLISFMFTSLDGFHAGPNDEFDWPNVDDDFTDFSISQMNDLDTLVFGRVTYEYMASYWPTPAALEGDPVTRHALSTFWSPIRQRGCRIRDRAGISNGRHDATC